MISRRILVASAMAAPFVAASRPVRAEGGLLDRLRKKGVLTFGTSNDVPYAYLDPITNKVTGIDAEILAAVLPILKIASSDTVQTSFGTLVPGLLASRFDIIADSMWITEKRKLQIDFSVPWYRYGDAMVVQKGNPKGLHAIADVKAGLRVGTTTGTVYSDWIAAIPGVDAHTYASDSDSFQDIALGRLDAIICDAPVAPDTLRQHPVLAEKLEVATPYQTREEGQIGAGFRKEDSDLKDAFNAALTQLKADGTVLAILKKWGLTENNTVA